MTTSGTDPVFPEIGVRPRFSLPPELRDWLRVCEIDDAERHAGDLFRHSFRSPPPDFPRHYVALYRPGADGGVELPEITVGYVHFTPYQGLYLGGGMCMDNRVVRRMPVERRVALKQAGGIAEQMLRYVFQDLSDGRAIFGYVGDTRAERIDLRVGFSHTGHEHLIVHWPRELPEDEKRRIVDHVATLGPF